MQRGRKMSFHDCRQQPSLSSRDPWAILSNQCSDPRCNPGGRAPLILRAGQGNGKRCSEGESAATSWGSMGGTVPGRSTSLLEARGGRSMALSDILVWIVGISCLGLIAQFLWIDRGHARGWFYVSLPILLLTLGGVALRWPWMTMTGQGAWAVLVLSPSLLFVLYHRLQVRQRFAAARRVALVIRALHPADGWRELPEMMRALDLAQRGDTPGATAIYRRFQEAGGSDALLATAHIYRI